MASRDKIIAKAEKYVSKGKIEDAISEYERLLKDSPNDVNTLNRIGDLWVRINRPKEAVSVFTQIADHYSRDGFFLKAIAIYKKINKLDPSRLDIYEKLAELYAKQGLAMEAKSQYLVLADYSIKQGNTQAALKTYKKISELDPNSINVHVKLADLHQQAGQKDEALKQYDRVGRLLLKKGMNDEALQVFRKAVKIDASNVELVSSIVTALNEAGQHSSAIDILETARSANPDDSKLSALLGRALIGSGDLGQAQSVLEQAVAVAPDDHATREALAELYLKQGNADQAFEIVRPRVDALIQIDDGQAAANLLNTIIAVDSAHAPSLEKLVEAHTKAGQETHAIAAMNNLAEAHLGRGDNASAVSVLEKLVEREPENEQFKKKLAFVQQQMGITPEAAPAPAPAPEPEPEPAPVEEISFEAEEEPAEEISLGGDTGPDLSFGLDESAAAEFGLSPEVAPEPEAVVEETDLGEPPPSLEEPGDMSDEDIAFVTEHMTEAEVFAKYGLLDRAIDHLNKVIERAPKHTPAYDKLFHTYLEEGQISDAGELGTRYISVLRELGETEKAEEIENELASHGVTAGAGATEAAVEEAMPELEPELEPEPEPEVELEPEEISVELEPEAEEFSVDVEPEEISMEIEEEVEIEEAPPELEAEEPMLSLDFDDESAAIELEPEELEAEELEAEELEAEELEAEELEAEEPELSFADEEASTAVRPPADAAPPPPSEDELSEIDFYIEQELYDEARERLEAMARHHPGHDGVASRLEQIAEKQAAPAEPEQPPALDIEAELLSAIPDDEEEEVATAPEPAPEPVEEEVPSLAAEITEEDEEGLFADEDDFFDLAAELEEELEGEDEDLSLAEEEQSLEDVFREFKKGVEEQLDAEDHDTHYNLGIAYKEMGLVDEAIGEFQIASKDPKRTVECCSMLGLCFLEKGMPQLAIKWYTKGLEMPEITEEEHLGLLYELGNAYVETGDTTQAHKTFVEIYGVNSNYRDVADRIKQLENVAQ